MRKSVGRALLVGLLIRVRTTVEEEVSSLKMRIVFVLFLVGWMCGTAACRELNDSALKAENTSKFVGRGGGSGTGAWGSFLVGLFLFFALCGSLACMELNDSTSKAENTLGIGGSSGFSLGHHEIMHNRSHHDHDGDLGADGGAYAGADADADVDAEADAGERAGAGGGACEGPTAGVSP